MIQSRNEHFVFMRSLIAKNIYQIIGLLVFLTTALLPINVSVGQDFSYEDRVYNQNIKSVTFHKRNAPLSFPVMRIGIDVLSLGFDDLSDEEKDYYYRIIHCDRNWAPTTELEEYEYLDGFNDEEFDDYDFSVNTYVPYIHYRLNIPNDDCKLLLSGNYLLLVYEDKDEQIPVLTRRFMVTEQSVSIGHTMKKPLKVQKINTHQEIDLNVNISKIRIVSPMTEVYVDVLQNYRWDNMLNDVQPKFTSRDNLRYTYIDKIIFPALKEYRSFDIRPLTFATEYVQNINLHDQGTDVLLKLDRPRYFANYHTRPDAEGFFVLDRYDEDEYQRVLESEINPLDSIVQYYTSTVRVKNESDIEGDYAVVGFTLKDDGGASRDVYIVGAFTNYRLDPEYRMIYNYNSGNHELDLLLKQGYYNYFYAVDNGGDLDIREIEGSWYETNNIYTVLVYYSEFGARYDRLIGYSSFLSNY